MNKIVLKASSQIYMKITVAEKTVISKNIDLDGFAGLKKRPDVLMIADIG